MEKVEFFVYFCLENCDVVGKIPCVDCLRKNKKKAGQFLFDDLELQALTLYVCDFTFIFFF